MVMYRVFLLFCFGFGFLSLGVRGRSEDINIERDERSIKKKKSNLPYSQARKMTSKDSVDTKSSHS